MTDDPPVIKIARVGLSLLTNPSDIPIYLSTLRKNPLEVELPWINLQAMKFLESFLRRDMTVFEYGSGGSTIFFARRCHRVVSIEDNHEWVAAVREALDRHCLRNTLIEFHDAGSVYTSQSAAFRQSSYLHAIDGVDPDVVLIDGSDEWQSYGREPYETRRSICFRYVEQNIKPGTIIILDDSSLYPEIRVHNRAKDFKSFTGVGPCRFGVTSTDVFFY